MGMATTEELRFGLVGNQSLDSLDKETILKLENVAGSSSSPYVRRFVCRTIQQHRSLPRIVDLMAEQLSV